MFVPVEHQALDLLWRHAEPYIERALSRQTKMTAPDVLRSLKAREKQLWLLVLDRRVVGALVTEVANWPGERVCTIGLFSADDGDRRWLDDLATIEAWATEAGCDAVEIIGRKGWQRLLPEDYAPTRVMYRRTINA